MEALVETIKVITARLEAMAGETGRLSEERDQAVAALHEHGWSYQKIADETGLSKARVQQIIWRTQGR